MKKYTVKRNYLRILFINLLICFVLCLPFVYVLQYEFPSLAFDSETFSLMLIALLFYLPLLYGFLVSFVQLFYPRKLLVLSEIGCWTSVFPYRKGFFFRWSDVADIRYGKTRLPSRYSKNNYIEAVHIDFYHPEIIFTKGLWSWGWLRRFRKWQGEGDLSLNFQYLSDGDARTIVNYMEHYRVQDLKKVK